MLTGKSVFFGSRLFGGVPWQWWNDRITQPNIFAGKVLARLYFVCRLTTLPVCIASAQIVHVRARSVAASGEPTDIAFLSSAGLRFIELELQHTI